MRQSALGADQNRDRRMRKNLGRYTSEDDSGDAATAMGTHLNQTVTCRLCCQVGAIGSDEDIPVHTCLLVRFFQHHGVTTESSLKTPKSPVLKV